MPEEERQTEYDPDEEYPWDCDRDYEFWNENMDDDLTDG